MPDGPRKGEFEFRSAAAKIVNEALKKTGDSVQQAGEEFQGLSHAELFTKLNELEKLQGVSSGLRQGTAVLDAAQLYDLRIAAIKSLLERSKD